MKSNSNNFFAGANSANQFPSYFESFEDDVNGGRAANKLAGRLRPKTLHSSASVPALKVSASQSSLLRQKSSEKFDTMGINASSKVEKSNPLLSNSSSGFFATKAPNSSSMLSKKAEVQSSTSSVDRVGSDEVISVQRSNQSPENGLRTFLESLELTSKEHHNLMTIPHSFLYLRMKTKDSSVYDLETCPQDDIDTSNYSTISKEGLTQYRNNESQFTTLVQFERDYKLYHLISRIRFFALYKRWKSFFIWKKSVRIKKITHAVEALQNSLFLLNPSLRRAHLSVREMSLGLNQMGMLNMKDGEIFKLEEFLSAQRELHDGLNTKFEELSGKVLKTVRIACDEVVDEFLKANNIVANHKMTFMERAALRAECRRLTKYLRLIDIMLGDLLRTMVQEMMLHLASCVESKGSDLEPKIECDEVVLKNIAQKRKENGWKNPTFRIKATLEENEDLPPEDSIILSPSQDDLLKGVKDVIDSAICVVGSLSTVFNSPMLEMYVMPDGEIDEDEEDLEPTDIGTTIQQNPVFVQCRDTIEKQIKKTYKAMKTYVGVFEPYRQLYFSNRKSTASVKEVFEEGTVEAFQIAIAEYRAQIEKFALVPKFADVGMAFVDSDEMKAQMTPSPIACLKAIQEWIPQLAATRCQELLDELGAMNPIIGGDPTTVEAYVLKKKTKDKANEQMEEFKQRQSYISTLCITMDDNQWPRPDNINALTRMLRDAIPALETNIQVSDGKEEDEVKKFVAQVGEEVPKMLKSVAGVREQLDNNILSNPDAEDAKVLKFISGLQNDFKKNKEKAEKLQEYQGVLKLNVDDFEVLDDVNADLQLKSRLWKDKAEWAGLREKVLGEPFSSFDVTSLEKDLTRFNKTVFLSGKALPTNKVVDLLKASVDEFNPVLPVVTDLRNPALKKRHWDQIHELVGVEIQGQDDLTLQDLISKGVTGHQESIATIATTALQESILEEMMGKVTKLWADATLEVRPYKEVKDLYILGDTSEIVVNLDDSLVTINTVLGSRYVGGIREFVDSWRSKLMHFSETLDEWLQCQRNWMYLETIFGSADIVRQLPVSAKMFQAVDKSWKSIMKATNDEPNAIKACCQDKTRRDVFRSHNNNLDQIQKDLEDYLETKRTAFPRFYFLSNDELLEILSQAKDPQAVQPHLRKCFDNLIKLEFGAEEGSIDILAMFSGEGERVPLGKNLKGRGNVEDWLNAVENRMKDSLHGCLKAGLIDYDQRDRDEWIFHHPGQVVATVAQMTWARGTEAALRSENPIEEMLTWSADYKNELQKLIKLIRGDLTKLMRCIVVALVTTDVHARDIIDELCEQKVTDTSNFSWQMQLRYYWEVDNDDCWIRHSDARIHYGYEYMGATSRLVITPLTDRCWMTLTGSYALKLGGAPAGPAGTGKTESSKDLAKAMAIQCVVFNCSDQIDYKMMGKLFRGLAQGGMWICLDEFNRIDIEVLSVIAQQLLVLREGRQANKSNINFMGIPIRLVDHHVIITMNPGYAGRTELPDNLQVCFRPVSMMVPNYALIAEIMLFAEGFGDAKNLSQKMCKLYILCSEQLSQQPHYDYGLRAVKSVLVMAGGLKRANPDLAEELVLIRALRDSNVPKFLADDLPLFAAIVQDLFPGVVVPSNDYGELQVALEEELDKAGLQKVPKFIGKVIQMFDIFNIRFGATLVGPAGTGKTTCYRILAALMTNLREKGVANQQFQKVKFQVLNPKCITMGELYGQFDPMTQEWHDGLASSIMRDYVAEESDWKRWTVFDGPIDALWIENMNTVLDDNMTLCLANGQRIKLKVEMKCLFEVNDLEVASPATVSRIGVVYMTPTDLGWIPYVQTWVNKDLPEGTPSWVAPRFLHLFETAFGKGMANQRKFFKEPVTTVDIQLTIAHCTLFKSLFTKENDIVLADAEEGGANFAALKNVVDKLFFFCYVWTVGASCQDKDWEAFSEHARELFEEPCPTLALPGGGNAFSYFVDVKEGKFTEWTEIIPSFTYNGDVPYFDLLVPTIDTCRFSYIMKSLITVDKPCFVTGVTGTGKTVTVQNLLNTLQPPSDEGGMGLIPIFVNFSAQTQSLVVQNTIEGKLEKKRKNLLGAPAGKKVVVFVDDVNMPLVETYGAQPPVELLRQFLDHKGFYDREKLFWKDLQDVMMFVGAAPPGGGRSPVTPRFTRHFNVLCVPPASETALTSIFEQILNGFIAKFEPEVVKMTKGIVAATIEIYHKISEDLLPTPSRFHYLFNLRDISKVFQGMLMIRSRKCQSSEVMTRLWIHECQRIFYDRLISEDDQEWFNKNMLDLCSRHLKISLNPEDVFDKKKPIVFADFMKPDADPRFYEDVRDLGKLTNVLNDLLDNYNAEFPSQMNLVFFTDALCHAVRISRILRQPRGNAMLIGVGGSGKQSLTRMAAFVGGMECKSIEIFRGYGMSDFREDIKKFMISAGVEGKDTVFLFTDSQIVDETMLEDLNNVLNTGEIPNLFPQDETDKIVSDMIPACKEAGIIESRDNCLSYFVSRVRDKLHVVLGMSPVGDALRIRCRQFPSLINCTTIDWFHGWPEAALIAVAERFLHDLDLPSEEIRAGVVKMCGFVHRSITTYSDKFYSELKRRLYTTPKSYLDIISLYMSMLTGLQDVVQVKMDRMIVGVTKLDETNAIVDSLQADLEKLAPVLKTKGEEAEKLLAQAEIDSAEANKIAEKVAADTAVVDQQAAETKAIADDAQADLDRAMPALESAVKALKSLTKADITEVKSFKNPPPAVKTVLECVCILLGEKPAWDVSTKLLSKSDFLQSLQDYDKDNIEEKKLKKLRKEYLHLEEMDPAVVGKVSTAGLGLCLWVRAMDVYADVAKEVEPKKAKLAEATASLDAAMAVLKEKQDALKEVQDKVDALNKLVAETVAEKESLQEQSDVCAARLVRAGKLTGGLSSEGVRWRESIVQLTADKTNLIGDCFLSCACVSYYGGFTGVYREELIKLWLKQARKLEIPASPKFDLGVTLGDPVAIREWQNQGLPTDEVSVNNAILVDKCRRWPLMIDPQQQANKWIKKMEESNNVSVITMSDPNLLRALENCIRLGKPLLIEDLGEVMEPALEPVLQKAVYKQGNRLLIHLGDSDIDYDTNFKLYMTSKMPNPHYLPEVCIKVTIINFTVTMPGLESQLLGDVVATERPDIEERKVKLLLQMADDKKQLQALESKILQMLSESEGNILDDEDLINTLSESKVIAIAIGERVAEAEVTEAEINDARAKYMCVATRGAIIYFVIADLALIDPMYQYSLEYYSRLFNRCVVEAEANLNLETRLENIINYSTLIIYQNICRGLFEKDKLLFSSAVCFQILRNSGEINDLEWNLFVRGPGAFDRSKQPVNPQPEKISPGSWDVLYVAEERLHYLKPEDTKSGEEEKKKDEGASDDLAAASIEDDDGEGQAHDVDSSGPPVHKASHPDPFAGLCDSIKDKYHQEWKKWEEKVDVMSSPLPSTHEASVNLFQRLILVKALREDKLQQAIATYVSKKLGPRFAESPNATMEDIYKDLTNSTPCIFILSKGADPTATLLRFAKKRNYDDRLHIVSLGQGQGPVATKLINDGCKTGDWVVLQNCMLAKSWMGEMDKIIFNLQEKAKEEGGGGIHPDFRLYLTSAPADYFPVSVLQNGVKMTNEPPSGFRANIIGSFNNLIKEEDWEGCSKSREWKKLLCGLAFFHANTQERRKFGPLGWNIRYGFDESDLETSIAVLRRFLEEQEVIPWDALNYATGQINYGGRVTDDWDRRCIMSILSIYFVPQILDDGYCFSKSGKYFAPADGSLEEVKNYILSLPMTDDPEVFGMHNNANVTFNTNESLQLMATLLSLQPRSSTGGGGKSSDDIVIELADEFEQKVPAFLEQDDAGPTTFVIQENGLLNSLAICLVQEMIKFNRLLSRMRVSLSDIKKAIRGMIVMSSDLDAMYTAFLNNQLPNIWEKVSFATLKTLGSWVRDLIFRTDFLRIWLLNGEPCTFPLPVFFFPQGFMTASLQTFARKHLESIDTLSFEFTVMREEPDELTESPDDGVYMYGLYLEGARFDRSSWMLHDSEPGKMFDLLPVIHFKPAVFHKQPPGTYQCPVYKTAVRKGVLSTTGMSTNFVVQVELPTDEPEQKWILAGVAALCNLTD